MAKINAKLGKPQVITLGPRCVSHVDKLLRVKFVGGVASAECNNVADAKTYVQRIREYLRGKKIAANYEGAEEAIRNVVNP